MSELIDNLILILDELAENRCCEHGIHNAAKSNDIAIAKLMKIIDAEKVKTRKSWESLGTLYVTRGQS